MLNRLNNLEKETALFKKKKRGRTYFKLAKGHYDDKHNKGEAKGGIWYILIFCIPFSRSSAEVY